MSATHERKALPFSVTFAAGAIAGISEILTFYPLDVVKTRMQLDTSKSGQSLVGTLRSIVAEQGFGRLYRGLLPPLLLEAPKRAIKFASNDFWSQTYRKAFNQQQMTQELSILTGCSAGRTIRTCKNQAARQDLNLQRPIGRPQAHSTKRRPTRAICRNGVYVLAPCLVERWFLRLNLPSAGCSPKGRDSTIKAPEQFHIWNSRRMRGYHTEHTI